MRNEQFEHGVVAGEIGVLCACVLNGAERERSEAFGGVIEDTIVRLSMSEYELKYVLEWIQRMARAYFARDNAQRVYA